MVNKMRWQILFFIRTTYNISLRIRMLTLLKEVNNLFKLRPIDPFPFGNTLSEILLVLAFI